MSDQRPLVAITVGDPHGVGSELVLKALSHNFTYDRARPLVICDITLLERTQEFLGSKFTFNRITGPSQASGTAGVVDVLDVPNIDWDQFHWGQISAMSGRASLDYVEKAMELASAGTVDAFVYGPLHKENMKRAGLTQSSEAEYMQELTGSDKIIIFLMGDKSIVTRVTTHVPFKDVPAYITKDNVMTAIQMTDDIMKRLGMEHPRIGLGALNPHAGEGGLCGREEVDEIQPAIVAARRQGVEIVGLYPADTLYLGFESNFRDGKLDVGIYMYHDIAGLTSKMLELGSMFTLTAGLPVPVFTVGHGTRYNRAGKGEVKETSMLNAIEYATRVRKV